MLLEFDAPSHTYRLDGAMVPSVTQVIAPIRDDFAGVPPDVLERKRQLGTAVHLACELDDEGELDEATLDETLVPYLGAWRKFRSETGFVVVLNEQQLGDPVLRFAGTVDRFGTIDGTQWLIDLKTSASLSAAFGVQLAGYQRLLGFTKDDAPVRRAAVQLRDDGSYRLQEYKNPNDWPAFMACLQIFNWKESTK